MRVATDHRPLLITAALGCVASAAVTVAWCRSMSMPGMEMPGGWTMSMTWMRMPGQGWPGAAAAFLGMWTVMMVAMMLPALVPMLLRYRRAIYSPRADALTARVAGGYFGAWTLAGALAFPPGVALAELAMRVSAVSRAVPLAAAAVLLLAGAWQLSAWKARQLACCREGSDDSGTAWRHGVRLGLRCVRCCAPLTAILLVVGVMDLRAMALVTALITAERVAPAGERVARAVSASARGE